VKGFHVR